jgi:hypothetical protein
LKFDPAPQGQILSAQQSYFRYHTDENWLPRDHQRAVSRPKALILLSADHWQEVRQQSPFNRWKVSRNHAQILATDEGFLIENMKSSKEGNYPG